MSDFGVRPSHRRRRYPSQMTCSLPNLISKVAPCVKRQFSLRIVSRNFRIKGFLHPPGVMKPRPGTGKRDNPLPLPLPNWFDFDCDLRCCLDHPAYEESN
eukprot:scaffold11832_cov155-Skeletonema_marinoi.AAC.4